MKIGFSMANEEQQTPTAEISTTISEETPVQSVVTVRFENGKEYPYYNDRFCLHYGDYVYVEGKLAGKLGRVIEYTEEFCVNLKYYKRVIQKVDCTLHGAFKKYGCYLISNDCSALTPEQILPLFFPPQEEGTEELVYGKGFEIELEHASDMDQVKTSCQYRYGIDSFYDGFLQYLSYDGKNGFAIVTAEKEPTDYVTVTFQFENGKIHTAFCNCIAPGYCAHLSTVTYGLSQFLQNEYVQAGNGSFIVISDEVFDKFISTEEMIITI